MQASYTTTLLNNINHNKHDKLSRSSLHRNNKDTEKRGEMKGGSSKERLKRKKKKKERADKEVRG